MTFLSSYITEYMFLSFSQLVGGRNSTNPAIWLVPGAGRIFSFGPPQRAGSSCWSIFVNELAEILSRSPFLDFHRRLINASLPLFSFKWQKCVVGFQNLALILLATFSWSSRRTRKRCPNRSVGENPLNNMSAGAGLREHDGFYKHACFIDFPLRGFSKTINK